MNILSLIISLLSGAVGGNVAGAAMKDKSLGTVGNSVAGIRAAASAAPSCKPWGSPARAARSILAPSSKTSQAAVLAEPS